jgi:uncharacterized membrane protein YkoI
MKRIKQVIMGIAALAALGLGGAAIAGAAGGNDTPEPGDQPDHVVDSATAAKAGRAATGTAGGDVISVERTDEGGKAVYEVKVQRAGHVDEVQVDSSFGIVSSKVDDEQADGADQQGEHGDAADGADAAGQGDQPEPGDQPDQPGQADQGDGDGEAAGR